MGTQEDTSTFHLAWLQDIGFNSYRFTNLTRWMEPVDDTAYGALTPAAIKANPNVIPWSTWDANADVNPQTYNHNLGQSVRQTIIQLENAGIVPLWQINERPPGDVPPWMPDATDPNAFNNTNNYNEMWEHCFAIAYWLNVRNNYNMDVYQIANEPDYEGYNQANYFAFFHLCRDAVQYVYATYLPGRTPIMTAPVESQNTGSGDWVDVMLQIMGGEVDWNVPILGGEQMYQAMKSLGRETQLVVYPGEYHGFKAPSHLKDRLERYLAWYAHYVKGDPAPATLTTLK